MSDVDDVLDDLGIVYLDGVPCPDELLAHVAAEIAARPRLIRPRATTSEAETFFAGIADTIKRAGGTPK